MQMDQMTQQNAALVEEIATSSENMQQQASELITLVEFFKVSENGKKEYRSAGPKVHTAAQQKPPVAAGHRSMLHAQSTHTQHQHAQPLHKHTDRKPAPGARPGNGSEDRKEWAMAMVEAAKPKEENGEVYDDKHNTHEEF